MTMTSTTSQRTASYAGISHVASLVVRTAVGSGVVLNHHTLYDALEVKIIEAANQPTV